VTWLKRAATRARGSLKDGVVKREGAAGRWRKEAEDWGEDGPRRMRGRIVEGRKSNGDVGRRGRLTGGELEGDRTHTVTDPRDPSSPGHPTCSAPSGLGQNRGFFQKSLAHKLS